jgi:hypothetical protein
MFTCEQLQIFQEYETKVMPDNFNKTGIGAHK